MNTGRGIGGRSQCFSCNKTLVWYELIPVVSYLIQRGKCRSCRTRISLQYPLVELVTGIAFAGVAWQVPFFDKPVSFIAWLTVISVSMIIAVYDIHHYVIPKKPLGILFAIAIMLGFHGWGSILVPLPFLVLWFISRGAWIGFGDVELMVCIGMLLGISGGISAVVLSFWIACAVLLPWVGIQTLRKKTVSHTIPFGPFLLFGMYCVGIGGVNLLTIINHVVL